MSSQNIATYNDCVTSLRTSLNFLESSVETLGNGVSDFPRLITILKTVRHYELIPQPTLAAAEASLRDEIGPYISLLLDRADRQLQRRERRIETLKARAELQHGRLAEGSSSSSSLGNKTRRGAAASATGRKLGGDEKFRARVIRQKKEALKYSVERLELEVLQKERELRKRLDS
ncbi:Uncharacterized protein SAPIO_CDS10034 [Scedosporium apiospermum]|uniref:DASH complex subunit SPC19 n=1 Tax=Pseudallescheria apiosperma TaxID=563466 RepID=A0A084FW81_PSEDA|nr:Uncharacterized protein SAPIO_CDS10034 [Scedosporium apiospermum]KEZ39343.1 Uncharacterized protein SAPIO_CDS10034 [Scedosporium apiospermum]